MRYPVPGMNPPVCDFRAGDARNEPLHLRAIDISSSGIALLLDDPRQMVAAGMVFPDAMLQFPDIGAIATDLTVMYVAPYGEGDARRLGVRFTNMKASALNHLQRYVQRLERLRLAAGLVA